jgi:5-methylcytosine-specific restriction endonuclease McrA
MIAERDGFVCQICGRVTAKGIADHIIPLAFGGEDIDENMQWLCVRCSDMKTKQESKEGKK